MFPASVPMTTCTLSTAQEPVDMQRLVDAKLAEMGMTDAFFAWLRERAPAHVARDALLGLYCDRAIALAEDETLALSDRLSALLRYEREEHEFIAAQPQALQPLIRGPTPEKIARFKALLGERDAAVAAERDALQHAQPQLLHERERLFERMAPMTRREQEAEDRLLRDCASLLRRIPLPRAEQSIEEVVQEALADPRPYDTSEFEAKIAS